MWEILSLILVLYVISLIFSMFVVLVKFIIDTWRWHDKEERVYITKSKFKSDLDEPEESEVKGNGSNSDESAECDTSIIL